MRVCAVILAAGLGTRMKSSLPKVAHQLNGKPMVGYVVDAVAGLNPEKTIVVIGQAGTAVRGVLEGYPVVFAKQKEQKGTADALKAAVRYIKGFDGTVLVVNGDTPLITTSTLARLLKLHVKNREDITVGSFMAEGPHAYGRILREGNKVKAIIEDRDAGPEQKKIIEVNSGIYALKSSVLPLLRRIRVNKAKGEYYLTDIAALASNSGLRVGAHASAGEEELTGINTRKELHAADRYLRERVIAGWMQRGVSFVDASSAFIHPDVEMGPDTLIYPNVYIEKGTVIGSGCKILPNSRITACEIGDNVTVRDSSVLESSKVMDGASIGPFAHIRPGSLIGPSARIGNFVEIKKTVIGPGTKASHLSYLGDAEIGGDVNIGAGTITCNYDGKNKHKTVIGEGVFIGSDTQFVAPVTVGSGAYIGAGSTITKDVPAGSLALSRVRQRHIVDWARNKKKK